jgi:Domain of unknown function (DUF6265)
MFGISRCFALIGIACLPLTAHAQSPAAERLAWMVGAWSQENEKETVTEIWQGPAGGMLVATNLTRRASGKASFEFLRIAETPTGLSYFAMPGGRAATEFKMRELGDRRVVFENTAHDFPQRILYWRDGEALMARVEGTANGKARGEEWRFTRSR